jgi:protease PrsW
MPVGGTALSQQLYQSRTGELSLRVVGAYVTVVILHGLWDLQPLLISGLSLPGPVVFVGEGVIGLTGLAILRRRWREARRLQDAEGVSGSF